MVQDIITSAIIASSAGYTLYNLYAMCFQGKRKQASHCGGCEACKTKSVLSYRGKPTV